MFTTRTRKAFRSAQLVNVIAIRFLSGKTGLKLHQTSRIILHVSAFYWRCLHQSSTPISDLTITLSVRFQMIQVVGLDKYRPAWYLRTVSRSSKTNHYSSDKNSLADSGSGDVKDPTDKTPLGLLLSLMLSFRTIERYLELELASHNSSPNKVLIMAALISNGGRMTPTQIARTICRRKNTITSTINALVEEGEVSVNKSEHDGRAKFVMPTDQGRETAVWLTPIAQDVSRRVLSALTDEEITMLVRSMRKVRNNLKNRIL